MNKLLIILLVLFFSSCKTENIYLTILSQGEVLQLTDTVYVVQPRIADTVYIVRERFTEEFQYSDSVFNAASAAAMKSAYLKTKHLLK